MLQAFHGNHKWRIYFYASFCLGIYSSEPTTRLKIRKWYNNERHLSDRYRA